MTRRRRILFSILGGAGCLVSAIGYFGFHAKSKRGRDSLPAESVLSNHAPSTVMVTVAPVAFRPVRRTVEAVGTLWGFEEVSISTKVEGRVLRILRDVADHADPGEVLLEIDPTDYELAVRQAEKSLGVELAKLGLESPPTTGFDINLVPAVVQASARMENAKSKLQRVQALAARNATAPDDVAERTTEYRVAQAEFNNQILIAKAGLATIKMRQEALAIAQQQLKDTQILTPVPSRPMPAQDRAFSYAITQRTVAEGSFVRPGATVFRLVIEHPLKLRLPVPERHAAEITVGQTAEVVTTAFAQPFQGTVTRINPAVDAATRTFEVELLIPNPEKKLKPGSFAKASIVTRLDDEAPMVPLESLVTFAGITKVFLVERGHAKEVQVVLGVQSTAWAEVTKPTLPQGATVVTSGQSALADGTAISIRLGSETAALGNDLGIARQRDHDYARDQTERRDSNPTEYRAEVSP